MLSVCIVVENIVQKFQIFDQGKKKLEYGKYKISHFSIKGHNSRTKFEMTCVLWSKWSKTSIKQFPMICFRGTQVIEQKPNAGHKDRHRLNMGIGQVG